MRSERSTQELLISASRLQMMSGSKQAELWQKIEDAMPKTGEIESPRKRRFLSYSHGKAVSVAFLSILTLCAVILIVPHVIQRAAVTKVTHNSLPKLTQESFRGTGFTVSPLKYRAGDDFVTANAVLRITDPAMKFWKGKTRDITLVNVSRKLGSSFVHLNASKTADDPHFKQTGDTWKNIPCYIVTIEGATGTIPALGTRLDPSPVQLPRKDVVIVDFVDATSGKILMEYQYGDRNGG